MRVTWNGTGSAWAAKFGNSSAVVEAEGVRLLVDCGHTVPARLPGMGLTLRDLDAVFISHLHGDHVYGLEEWGFRNFLIWNSCPTLFLGDAIAAPLWTHVLSGTMAQVCEHTCLLHDYFTTAPLAPFVPRAFGPFTLEICPVVHVPHAQAFGLKVRAGDACVAFTCDSLAPVPEWFYADTQAVFHDCAFYPWNPETVHAHFEQIREYPEAWRAKTFLVHYGDEIEDKRADPVWRAELAATDLRLAEPYAPLEV